MEVRPGGTTRLPDPPEHLAPSDFVSLFHGPLAEVEIHGDQSVSVIQEQTSAGKEEVSGEDHLAVGDRQHGSSLGDAEVRARVRTPGLTVEEPSRAEPLFRYFVDQVKNLGLKVETGIFAASMDVSIVNEGPVTFILQKRKALS